MKDRSVWDVVTFNQTRRNQNGYVDLAYAARVTDGVEVDNAFSLSVPAQKGQKKAVSTETDEGDGKIVYPQAFGENTYVEYINTYSGFKENIVLEKNIGKNTFDFVWESDEYMPVLTDDDKAICVVPKNDPTQSEYTISPLYVYDSFDPTTAEKPSTHKHWTDDCRYDILEQDDGSYIVRAIVSEEYLNHPETVYPVTVDPSVNAGSASSNVDDSFVKESAKTTNYGTYNYLQFGYASGKMYSFVQFNKMPALAAGAHYTSATFKVTFRTGQDTPAKMKATARWCDSSFAEKKLTWNNRPYGKVAQSSVLPKITNGYLDYYNFTVTDAVQRHYKDGVDVALVFTYQNETYADYNSVVSSEGDAARNPKLTINYTKSTGETAGITNNACYYIRNKATNKYLGLREGGFISVEQQARTGKANQLWKLQYNGKDAYRLASQSLANSYMYAAVDMDGGSVYAVSPQSDDIAGGYEFMIEPVTTGYYRVSSKAVSTLYALTGGRYDSEDASVYTYTGANDQQWAFEKYTLSLSAAKNWVAAGSTLTLKPSSTVLGIAWSSSNNAVATVKGGIVTGVKPGTATITASAGGATAKYTVTVRNADPFCPDNIEQVRIHSWPSVKTDEGIKYEYCDMTTVATKSILQNEWFFTVLFPDTDEITTFEIDSALKKELQSLEEEYDRQLIKNGRANCFHFAKTLVDVFVDEGKIAAGSAEYYGIWAYNGNSACEISDRLSLDFTLISLFYSGFQYGFTTIMSLQATQLSTGQVKTFNSSSYNNAVKSQQAISDITDDAAVTLGKTDAVSNLGKRRSWRGSEMRAAEDYTLEDGFQYNKSYTLVDGKLTATTHGAAGSQRPDFYNEATNRLVEVKNYNITTATGRNNLAKNIAAQYNKRREMFPTADIRFEVDIYGQAYTRSMLDDVRNRVENLLGTHEMVKFMID